MELTLNRTIRNQTYVCTRIDCCGENQLRMRKLGICVGRKMKLIADGDPMIVQVCATQVGLSKKLASTVGVEPVAS